MRHLTASIGYADAVLGDLRDFADSDLPLYSECLRDAFAGTEPVFVRQRYGEFFWHCATAVPGWLARVVLANAQAESDGATKLLNLWRQVHGNQRVSAEVLVHAEDEAGHSRLFVELTGAAFPGALSRRDVRSVKAGLTKIDRAELTKAAVPPLDEVAVVDHLVQMNIGEIRTRAHMHLLGPAVLAASPESNGAWVERTLQRLGGDEVRHIGYTARLMEAWCCDGMRDIVQRLYADRLREFHIITVAQTEAAVRSYGNNAYPDLLEI